MVEEACGVTAKETSNLVQIVHYSLLALLMESAVLCHVEGSAIFGLNVTQLKLMKT